MDREKQLKKPLKIKEESERSRKVKKINKIHADSGWFHKGEHEQVFSCAIQVACDKNVWSLLHATHHFQH